MKLTVCFILSYHSDVKEGQNDEEMVFQSDAAMGLLPMPFSEDDFYMGVDHIPSPTFTSM